MLLLSKFQDLDDCAKMFICQLSTKPQDNLDDIEQNISGIFGTNEQGTLDATKPSGAKYLVSFFSRSLKTWEKYISLAQFVYF